MQFLIKFCLIISVIMVQSCKPKSQIIDGKICPHCLADNPSWRQNFCGTCYIWDRKVLTPDEALAILGGH